MLDFDDIDLFADTGIVSGAEAASTISQADEWLAENGFDDVGHGVRVVIAHLGVPLDEEAADLLASLAATA